MAKGGWFNDRKMLGTGAGVLLALLASTLTAPAHAAPAAAVAPDQCPAPVPLASVSRGMVGQGLTVVQGSTPEPFDVEVLGVLDDGLGADRDLILIKVSDQPGRHVVDQGAGIWAGMSGSPVYVDGKLLGAVAYGFTAAPSAIGGVTPAEDMQEMLTLGGAAPAQARVAAAKAPRTVTLPRELRRELAAKSQEATPRGALKRLVTPVSVSGLSGRRLDRLQGATDAAGLGVKLQAGSRASSTAAAAPASLQAGGNFAAALSYGDLTWAGVGTTTAVCGNQVLAFGHPFDSWMGPQGPIHYGASDADAVTVVKDDTFGSFKLANISPPQGTVDQDRFAGVRGNLGTLPAMADVTTLIHNRDTGKSRSGLTRVADPASLPGLLVGAVWSNYDAVFDEWGDGTATSEWTITGTRAGGRPFSVSRANQWASKGDVTIDPAFDVAFAADALVHNEFEDVDIDSVTFGSKVATRYQQLNITKMTVSVNGGKYRAVKQLRVKAGAKLRIKVSLKPYHGTATTTTTLRMTVPKKARGRAAELAVVGGTELAGSFDEEFDEGCLFGDECESSEDSLDDVLNGLEDAPRNDDVVAQLLVEDEDEEEATPVASAHQLQPLTVVGGRSITLRVRR